MHTKKFIRLSFFGISAFASFLSSYAQESAPDSTVKKLTQITVRGNAHKYTADSLSPSLRLASSLIEIPQNIQSVRNDALKDRQIISMNEGIFQNVSGTNRVEGWGDISAILVSRGSQLQAFRNGFNVNFAPSGAKTSGPLTEDMSFVDYIEFVKGPAGFMTSNGNPGGLYNVVTKKPNGQSQREISFSVGSFDLYRAAIDVEGKFDKKKRWLYRLNLSAQNRRSHRNYEYNDRYVAAPVLTYAPNKKLRLTLEYIYQRAHMMNTINSSVYAKKGFGALPRDFAMLPPGMPTAKIDDHSLSLNIVYAINSFWRINAQLAYLLYEQNDGCSLWPIDLTDDGKMIRVMYGWRARHRASMAQLFINGEAHTGAIRHRLLFGIDLSDKEYATDWWQPYSLDSAGAEFDTRAPNYGRPPKGFPVFDFSKPLEEVARGTNDIYRQGSASLYIQDELSFFHNKLRLTLAARYTYVDQFQETDRSASRVTPRVGLSFSIDKHLSVYALYDQSFIPQGGKLADKSEIKPITGDNFELGVKKDWFEGKWNTSLSLYYILSSNELTSDPNSRPPENFSIVLGEKRAQGIEFDMKGQLSPSFRLIANYAYTDSRISQVAEGVKKFKAGDPVPPYSAHTANAWLSYTIYRGFLKHIGLSTGFSFLGDRNTYWVLSPDPTERLPNYIRWDAGVSWANSRFRVILNVFNLLNAYLYNGSYDNYAQGYSWQSEPGVHFRLSIHYHF